MMDKNVSEHAQFSTKLKLNIKKGQGAWFADCLTTESKIICKYIYFLNFSISFSI
jgi:hypothetical protein